MSARVSVPTFTATVYAGLRSRYSGEVYHAEQARQVCREYCDKVGLCVWISEGNYLYTRGEEPGVAVGLINYPRFPKEPGEIKRLALDLASLLKESLDQLKVSVVFPDETVMLITEEEEAK